MTSAEILCCPLQPLLFRASLGCFHPSVLSIPRVDAEPEIVAPPGESGDSAGEGRFEPRPGDFLMVCWLQGPTLGREMLLDPLGPRSLE